eukprot:UN26748
MGWYQGVGVQVASVAPITAIQVMINGILERLTTGGTRNSTKIEQIINSCLAGAISSVVYCPADLTMIHQQKLNLSAINTLKHIMKTHGTMRIYRGLVSTAVREAIYTCGYLGMAPVFAKLIQEQSPNTGEITDR